MKLIAGALTVFAGLVGNTAGHAAITAYSNDFSSNQTGFSGGTIVTAPSGQKFLSFGGAGGSATLGLTGLAPHTSVQLSFSLYAVGSVDGNGPSPPGGGTGDYFAVSFDSSSTLFNQAFANYGSGEVQSYPIAGSAPGTGAAMLNGLGYTGFPAAAGIQDAEYAFTLAPVADSASAATFTFGDNSNEGAANEFYGIDNVVVTTNGTGTVPVPEPLAVSLFAAGLAMTALVRRRQD